MDPNVENNIFSSLLGIWLGYLLTQVKVEHPTSDFYVYLVIIFLGTASLSVALRRAFSLRRKHVKRVAEYIVIGGFVIILPQALENNVTVLRLDDIKDWQISLIAGIILSWIVAIEIGAILVPGSTPRPRNRQQSTSTTPPATN